MTMMTILGHSLLLPGSTKLSHFVGGICERPKSEAFVFFRLVSLTSSGEGGREEGRREEEEEVCGMVINPISHPDVVRLRLTKNQQHAISPLLDELEPYKHHHETRVYHV